MGFGDDAFPHPLPELCLRGPELLPVFADHQRRFLLLFLFLFRCCSHSVVISDCQLPIGI